MFKDILRSIAWRILDKELRENWIQRSHFNEYTQWMSRDFPVMEDMYEHFKSKPYGQAPFIAQHRQKMADKYKTKSAGKNAGEA